MESDPITPDAADRPDARPPAGLEPAAQEPDNPAGGDGSAASGAAADELVLLTSIEEDLAAVDAAMAALDGIDTTAMDGATAAAQVEAIAGHDRFAPTDPTAPTAPTAPAAPAV